MLLLTVDSVDLQSHIPWAGPAYPCDAFSWFEISRALVYFMCGASLAS